MISGTAVGSHTEGGSRSCKQGDNATHKYIHVQLYRMVRKVYVVLAGVAWDLGFSCLETVFCQNLENRFSDCRFQFVNKLAQEAGADPWEGTGLEGVGCNHNKTKSGFWCRSTPIGNGCRFSFTVLFFSRKNAMVCSWL